jgi:acyl-CoA thioester hydrolase
LSNIYKKTERIDVMQSIYKVKVQHENTDCYGIAHHSAYIKWIESARNEFIEEHEVCFKHLQEIGVKILISEMELKYKKPLFLMDELTIFTRILNLKKYCIEFESIIKNSNNEIVFKCKLKAVCTDIHNKLLTRIPDYIYLSLSKIKVTTPGLMQG